MVDVEANSEGNAAESSASATRTDVPKTPTGPVATPAEGAAVLPAAAETMTNPEPSPVPLPAAERGLLKDAPEHSGGEDGGGADEHSQLLPLTNPATTPATRPTPGQGLSSAPAYDPRAPLTVDWSALERERKHVLRSHALSFFWTDLDGN